MRIKEILITDNLKLTKESYINYKIEGRKIASIDEKLLAIHKMFEIAGELKIPKFKAIRHRKYLIFVCLKKKV